VCLQVFGGSHGREFHLRGLVVAPWMLFQSGDSYILSLVGIHGCLTPIPALEPLSDGKRDTIRSRRIAQSYLQLGGNPMSSQRRPTQAAFFSSRRSERVVTRRVAQQLTQTNQRGEKAVTEPTHRATNVSQDLTMSTFTLILRVSQARSHSRDGVQR
jgi:hypothetical protein